MQRALHRAMMAEAAPHVAPQGGQAAPLVTGTWTTHADLEEWLLVCAGVAPQSAFAHSRRMWQAGVHSLDALRATFSGVADSSTVPRCLAKYVSRQWRQHGLAACLGLF